MIQVPMTREEFDKIEAQLQSANPADGVSLIRIGPTNGDIIGTHPFKWSADFTYDGTQLTIHGHGAFVGDKVEKGLQSKLTEALTTMRNPPDVVRAV